MLPLETCSWCKGTGVVRPTIISFINNIIDIDEAEPEFWSIYEAVEAKSLGYTR